MSALILFQAETSVTETGTKASLAIVAEVTLTDDSRQAVSKELRLKNKQMDGSPMGAIVLRSGLCKLEKTMKYRLKSISVNGAFALDLYHFLHVFDFPYYFPRPSPLPYRGKGAIVPQEMDVLSFTRNYIIKSSLFVKMHLKRRYIKSGTFADTKLFCLGSSFYFRRRSVYDLHFNF